MDFKHILFTRFNIYYKTKMAQKGFDPEFWLLERFEIFRKYCFPSVVKQSNLNFTWMIYVDSETTPAVYNSLKELITPYPFILLVKRKFSHFSLKLVINEDIHQYFGQEFGYLISSRVDTDDMLHWDYIQSVQQRFNFQDYEALNFNKGLVYDIETGVSSTKYHFYNAFISLVEKRKTDGFLTVFYKLHINYSDDPKKTEIKNQIPMWCVTVHGLNVSTSFYGEVFKFSQPDLKALFGFEFQKKPKQINVLKFTIRSFRRTFEKVKVRIFGPKLIE
ncbi:hypothetical protein J0A67_04875 [Algoriphagus aestuariicola]|uniref:Rhamnosyl transferase n=1 Tax=Algoriphagus aestuariicola TaxID=1852016 RepID=A0ABS3BPJ6_9BACT|nr:glycosyltransferase [Algoriphagus aestuariicola]MBN7800181.1 hypothetical protein [Algoriphagus aestuariicola]